MTREEAINEIKSWAIPSEKGREVLETLIPELAESEDERIRMALIKLMAVAGENYVMSATGFKKEQLLAYLEKQKEQKPILEVFGFKVGDAVRLKDGDGRKHIIKSFEKIEGLHGPNFYHVEFEDNSARDGIYPGEEYPNGYYTQMEKFEEEQKPAEIDEYKIIKKHITYDSLSSEVNKRLKECGWYVTEKPAEWDNLQEDFRNINEAFEDGKKEVVAHPEKYDLCKPAEWSANDKAFIKDCAHILDENGYAASAERLLSMFPVKPAEWSDTNELVFKDICKHLKEEGYSGWVVLLNALRNGEFQLKQEWSEEDDMLMDELESYILYDKEFNDEQKSWRIKRLKSLRPSWKPNEEQMNALKVTLDYMPDTFKPRCTLMTLQDDLKKQM